MLILQQCEMGNNNELLQKYFTAWDGMTTYQCSVPRPKDGIVGPFFSLCWGSNLLRCL